MNARLNVATETANQETMLTPRFYRTDMQAFEDLDLTPVRDEWDQMMNEFESDGNVDHFQRDDRFQEELKELPPKLREDFLDFMISSVTSEYSGCVLYGKIADAIEHPDIKKLMEYMRRDEARHAGFINRALKDFGLAVDLGFLKREKKETFFKPKYIYYATYLSEKIGYARYITIFRHLERNPEYRFHPLFRWFEQWCNDEFRHGEAFALIMRAQPELLRGHNRLWIRFFLLSVYATMYVRDHTRPHLFEGLGMDPTDYDYTVFSITSEISKQVFPLTLDTDSPAFRAGLEHLRTLAARAEALRGSRNPLALLRRAGLGARMGVTFLKLFLHPVRNHDMPLRTRLVPSW